MLGILTPLLLALPGAERGPEPKLPVSKETTYVTGPLDDEGYIDYEAALNRRLGKGVTPDKNANVLLWKALGPRPEGGEGMPAEFFKLMGIDEPPAEGDYFIDLHRYTRDHLKRDPAEAHALYEQVSRAGQRPWSAKDYPHLAGWLKANEKPLALAIEASRRPQYFNPLVSHPGEKKPGGLLGVLMPSVQKCRELAAALAARALLRAGEGKLDEAWQDILACHRLGRLVARGGTIIEALVGMAIDRATTDADLAYLGHERLTAKRVRGCLKDLQALPPLPPMADKIDLGERFIYLDSVQMIRRGGLDTLEGLGDKPPPEKSDPDEERILGLIDWDPALRDGNRFYDRMAAAMRIKDRPGREKAFAAIEEDLQRMEARLIASKRKASQGWTLLKLYFGWEDPGKMVGRNIADVLIGLLMPALRKLQVAADRAEQVGRNRELAFALAAHRFDHGRYPERLADLAPKYLATVPGDLFTGTAPVYRPDEKGYVLYSVGVNGRDEGGRGPDDEPPGDDLAVRMPLPGLESGE